MFMYMKQISGQRLQDHWSSGWYMQQTQVSVYRTIGPLVIRVSPLSFLGASGVIFKFYSFFSSPEPLGSPPEPLGSQCELIGWP